MGRLVIVVITLLLGAAALLSYTHGKQKHGHSRSAPSPGQEDKKPRAPDLSRLHQDLSASQTKVRVRAAHDLKEVGDESSIPFLLNALADAPKERPYGGNNESGELTVRYWANEALKKISGRDFHFEWDADSEDREIAILRWRKWYTAKIRMDKSVAAATSAKQADRNTAAVP